MTSRVTIPRVARIVAAVVGRRTARRRRVRSRPIDCLFGGIGSGALYAAIALGVVLTYKGSGVVNFANGATAMYMAYIYDDLRTHGQIFLPPLPNPLALVEGVLHAAGATGVSLPDWPTQLGTGTPMSFWPAMLISLALCRRARAAVPLPDLPASARRTTVGQGRGVGRPVHPPPGDRDPALHLAGTGHRAHHAQATGQLPGSR